MITTPKSSGAGGGAGADSCTVCLCLNRYIPFPPQLVGKYQSYTQADPAKLREAGYRDPFLTVEEGVRRYVEARRSATV